MKAFTLAIFISIVLTSTSFAMASVWETTATGRSSVSEAPETGQKYLWVFGETAESLFKELEKQSIYNLEIAVAGFKGAHYLVNSENHDHWLCIKTLEEHREVDPALTEYLCRIKFSADRK